MEQKDLGLKPDPDKPEPPFEWVCDRGDIPLGEGRAFEVGDRMIAIFNDEGAFRAIDDACPHMGASLSAGHLEESVVSCPWHAWRFDTRDGTWCDNRRIGIDYYLVVEWQQKIFVDPTPRRKSQD